MILKINNGTSYLNTVWQKIGFAITHNGLKLVISIEMPVFSCLIKLK